LEWTWLDSPFGTSSVAPRRAVVAADPASVAIGVVGKVAGKARRAARGGVRDKVEWLFAVTRGMGDRLANAFTAKREAETEVARKDAEVRDADVKLRLAEVDLKLADVELRRAQVAKAWASADKEAALAADVAVKALGNLARLREKHPDMAPRADEISRGLRPAQRELPPADTH
jgi:hypothetical protein